MCTIQLYIYIHTFIQYLKSYMQLYIIIILLQYLFLAVSYRHWRGQSVSQTVNASSALQIRFTAAGSFSPLVMPIMIRSPNRRSGLSVGGYSMLKAQYAAIVVANASIRTEQLQMMILSTTTKNSLLVIAMQGKLNFRLTISSSRLQSLYKIMILFLTSHGS